MISIKIPLTCRFSFYLTVPDFTVDDFQDPHQTLQTELVVKIDSFPASGQGGLAKRLDLLLKNREENTECCRCFLL